MTAHLAHLGGDGPPLVLIHGFGADRLSFLSLIATQVVSAAFYAVELPGHGAAGQVGEEADPAHLADAVAEAVAPLSAPFPVLGHSLGGAVALHLATRHPALVSRLVLIAPAGWGSALDNDFLKALPLVEDANAAQDLLERLVLRPRHIPKGLGAQVLSDLSPRRRDDLSRIADAVLMAPAPPVPDIPVTLIWGAEDAINLRDAARTYPDNVTEHIIPGAGHLPHFENAGETARIVAQALA